MTTDTQNQETTVEKDDKSPDYIVKQYRYVRVEDGLRLRKDTVGVAWSNSKNGSITIRPNGKQIIENDLYLFAIEDRDSE